MLLFKKLVCFFITAVFIFCSIHIYAQAAISNDTPSVKETKTENRQKLYKSLVNGINRNLSFPLTIETEENWMDAFYSIELLRYKSPWVESKINDAFKGIEARSGAFQYALMECVFDAYPNSFEQQVSFLLDTTTDAKCFAACAEYLLKKGEDYSVLAKLTQRIYQNQNNQVISALWYHTAFTKVPLPPLKDLLTHTFYANNKIVFSFQRKNRNYPGIAIVKDSAGNFVKDDYGNIFSVPQLARSITNLPGYLSNGNTPQGIFRMKGIDVSKSIFIGPTPNIQLTLPGETTVQHFFNDSTINDSTWTQEWYRDMLPKAWKSYTPIYETFWAGMAGRTEIIAHGTTVDPNYYKGTSYFPLTPTLGCLCTKEIWDEETGKRKQSDQQKLVTALQKAGGADGYYIVIELNDEQRAVDINDILPYLK